MRDRQPPLPEEWDESFSMASVECLRCKSRGVQTVVELAVPDGTQPNATFDAICFICAQHPQAALLYDDYSPFRVWAVWRVRIVG